MTARRRHIPLRVVLNGRLVGLLTKQSGVAISFTYDESWLTWEHAIPVSLSLPLRENAYHGEPVIAIFENLLPDSEKIRKQIAEKVGANGKDAYSLLAAIGRDCVGALQFIPDQGEEETKAYAGIEGEKISDHAIEELLNNLPQISLGLGRDQDFRISIAGAQEKTALLWHNGQWHKPHGSTPTTHIFKAQIGQLPNGIDLSNSVENEYYCLKLLELFGLEVNQARMMTFGKTKALVIERFDRLWTKDGRLLRIPQEDCCQALAIPPARKYQSDGGPDMIAILKLLQGSDTPEKDQKIFLKAQILFWMIGATDGHAKNFSITLGAGGRFHLTPLYDVLTAQPSLETREIERKQMKLAMSVGDRRHYKIQEIQKRHFLQTGKKAGLSQAVVEAIIDEVAHGVESVVQKIEDVLPHGFPENIHSSVKKAMLARRVQL